MLSLPLTVRDVATAESVYCLPQIRLPAYGLTFREDSP
jgi:hypothetical protein